MEVVTNHVWRYERNVEPLVDKKPQAAKSIATAEEMMQCLWTVTPFHAESVIMVNSSPRIIAYSLKIL